MTDHSVDNSHNNTNYPQKQISSVYFRKANRKSQPGQAITAYVPSSHPNNDTADGAQTVIKTSKLSNKSVTKAAESLN